MTRKTITIGEASMPLDAYSIGGTALLGIRGSGKTYTGKGIAEQLLEHRVPIIAFDPIGVWRYLKVPAAKNGKGYPVVVAGGRGADLLLTPQTAAEIVRAAMRENISLIIDLYDKTLSKADWRRIVQTCFRTLLYENEGVRHIFLEEAAEYCPQKVQDGETYAEVEKLVRMGGNASLGITLINQRAQEVNKAVLDLCENLVLMRQMGAHAIDALEKWIDKVSPDFAGKIAAGMPKMQPGEAWVFAGGADKPIFTRSATLRTYHPDRKNPDAKVVASATDTSAFVEALQRALPAIVEQQQANDPKKLKARIAELERAAARAPAAADSAIERELRARIATLEQDNAALERHRDDIAAAFDRTNERLIRLFDHFAKAVEEARPILNVPNLPPFPAITKPSTPAPAVARARLPSKPAAAVPAPRPAKPNGGSDHGLPPAQFKILRALYWLRDEDRTPEKIGFYAGYRASSGHFGNMIGALRSAGLADGWNITESGKALIGAVAGEKPAGAELREWLRPKLEHAQNKMLDVLIEADGRRLSNLELGAAAGYAPTSGHFANMLGGLRTIGAAEGYEKDGGTRAADVFLQ